MARIPELKLGRRTVFERLLGLTARFGRAGALLRQGRDEPPLRVGALQRRPDGAARQEPRRLRTGWHRAARPDRLLARLAENETILADVCDLLTAAVAANRRITPAAEWLLDNFYLIEEQIRTAKRHLPKGYSRELPRLAHGPSAGLPRVYDIALEMISHGDGRVDAERLSPLRRGLPDGHAAQAGRAVGHPDHAAAGADREPAPRRRPRSPPARSTATGPMRGRTR